MNAPAISKRPPIKLAAQAVCHVRVAHSPPDMPGLSARMAVAIGSMTFHAEMKPAGVLMPYGRAVTSVRPS